MKKYLLIPMLFIAALATANADCGSCGGDAEKKCEEKCDKECKKEHKEKCCDGKGKSCCATEKEHKHE